MKKVLKGLSGVILVISILLILTIVLYNLTINLPAVGIDVSLLFIVGSVFCIIETEKYRGLNLYHLFLVTGIIAFIISIILLLPFSDLSIFINKYGLILVPIAFIIVPIYAFILMPKSQYYNIIKLKHIEATGKCIGYDYTTSRGRKMD